jgi:hypothetical protein
LVFSGTICKDKMSKSDRVPCISNYFNTQFWGNENMSSLVYKQPGSGGLVRHTYQWWHELFLLHLPGGCTVQWSVRRF